MHAHIHGPLFAVLVIAASFSGTLLRAEDAALIKWQELAPLPAAGQPDVVGIGVAAPFAGVSRSGDDDKGVLIVAGGANFPDGLWKDGAKNPLAKKVWWDTVWVLDRPSGEWVESDPLPRPNAYGASVSTSQGVICIGGGDADTHFADVFLLAYRDGRVQRESLPYLPTNCAFTGAVVLDDVVYVAGGRETPTATSAMHTFWSFDVSKGGPPLAEREWNTLRVWPGAPRMLSIIGAQDGSIIVAGGTELYVDDTGATVRRYLTDGYRYTPGKQGGDGLWKPIASLPRAVVAPPVPAPPSGGEHLLVFGGDDGSLAARNDELADKHPGFSRDILAYHTVTDTWRKVGDLPAGHVTATVVTWGDQLVIPSGEVSPGIRSPSVLAGTLRTGSASFAVLDYITLVVYFIALVLMGVYFSRREKSTEDYFLAGRRIPWWAAGLSIFGTQLSAITFMAIPAHTFRSDWIYIVGNFCITIAAPIFVFFYLPVYRRRQLTTAYEYLEQRFSSAVRKLGSASFVLFQLGRIGIVLYLPALALSKVTGTNIYASVAVMGILATAYTVLGGISAVIWTDVIQVFVLLGGALVGFVVIAADVEGGFGGMLSIASDAGKFRMVDWSWDITTTAIWVVVVGKIIENFIPYSSDQTVVQRYLTTSSEKTARRALWTNAFLTIPASLLFFGLGTALWVYYSSFPERLDPSGRGDDILPWFVATELPAGIAGLVIAGLFAAAMSSIDSSMNSIATAITTDFYRPMKPGAPDEHYLRFAKGLTFVVGAAGTLFALYMAALQSKSMFDQYIKVIGLFGGGMAGLFALGVFVKQATPAGAIGGFVCSAIVLFLVKSYTPIHFFLYGAVGMGTCVLVGWVLSLATGGPKSESVAVGEER